VTHGVTEKYKLTEVLSYGFREFTARLHDLEAKWYNLGCQQKVYHLLFIGLCIHRSNTHQTISWHDGWSSCHDSEQLSTSFFWWRPLKEVETSKVSSFTLVVLYEFI